MTGVQTCALPILQRNSQGAIEGISPLTIICSYVVGSENPAGRIDPLKKKSSKKLVIFLKLLYFGEIKSGFFLCIFQPRQEVRVTHIFPWRYFGSFIVINSNFRVYAPTGKVRGTKGSAVICAMEEMSESQKGKSYEEHEERTTDRKSVV